jgi:hypothetical protein
MSYINTVNHVTN